MCRRRTLTNGRIYLHQRATLVQALSSPWPHSDKLSMCSSNSGQVMTPGVESGATKSGQVHLGKAPTSLHMSTQTPASLFWRFTRFFTSSVAHAEVLPTSLADAEANKRHATAALNCI